MIVVDTSAVLAALCGNDPARKALDGERLAAPCVIDAEVAHALRGLALGAKVSEAEAADLLASWGTLAVDRLPMPALLPRVWELRHNLTADDALFVAAAEALGIPLVTADRRLAGASGTRCEVRLLPT